MDAAGWVDVSDVLRLEGLDRSTLDAIVENNDKGRLQVAGEKIRACQGHSLENMPVTREALEASWAPYDGQDRIWHGTQRAVLDPIATHGIVAQARTHVHLAAAPNSRVGKRARVQVLLAVSVARLHSAGHRVWRAPNGVLLTRFVPPGCIEGALAMDEGAAAPPAFGASVFPWLPSADA